MHLGEQFPEVLSGERLRRNTSHDLLGITLRRAKNAGFDAIEIRMGDEISLDSTPEQMRQLAGEASKAGVAIAARSAAGSRSRRPTIVSRTPFSRQRFDSVCSDRRSSRMSAVTSGVGRLQLSEENA